MTTGVTDQAIAAPEQVVTQQAASDKELNFRRLEEARERDREERLKAQFERDALKQQLDAILQASKPKEPDILDGLEQDSYVDVAKFRAVQEKQRSIVLKEAEERARQAARDEFEQLNKKDYRRRLQSEFSDYNQVVTDESIKRFAEENPILADTLVQYVPDQFEQGKRIYLELKKSKAALQTEVKPSVQDKVTANQTNPFYHQGMSGATGTDIDFNVGDRSQRDAAYARLKAAQKNPVAPRGSGSR